MSKFTMSDDLVLVVRTRQWLSQQGLEEHFANLIDESIKERKNPFATLRGGLDAAIKLLAEHLPSRNGHKSAPATIEAPAEAKNPEATIFDGPFMTTAVPGLEPGDTIKPPVSLPPYEIQLSRLKKISGPNFVRAWLQLVPANVVITGDDIQAVLEANVRGFRVRPEIQKQAATDNVAYALRNVGILKWVENDGHYRRSKFFKPERIGRMLTNNIIQIYLDGGIPFRKKQRKTKTKTKAKARK